MKCDNDQRNERRKEMICLFHKWRLLKSENFRDVTRGEPGFPGTRFFYQCSRCDKRRVKYEEGHWSGWQFIDKEEEKK